MIKLFLVTVAAMVVFINGANGKSGGKGDELPRSGDARLMNDGTELVKGNDGKTIPDDTETLTDKTKTSTISNIHIDYNR